MHADFIDEIVDISAYLSRDLEEDFASSRLRGEIVKFAAY